jgi:hypothetical protein
MLSIIVTVNKLPIHTVKMSKFEAVKPSIINVAVAPLPGADVFGYSQAPKEVLVSLKRQTQGTQDPVAFVQIVVQRIALP